MMHGNLRTLWKLTNRAKLIIYIHKYITTTIQNEQMLVGESSEKWWPLYKYWPQGSFARIFHQLLGIDNQNSYGIF